VQASIKDEKKQVVEKSMETQDKQAEAHASEIVAVLSDIARLSLYNGNGSTTKNEISSIPARLFERLLELCVAQRGAVLLVMSPDHPHAAVRPVLKRDVHYWVLHNLQEEEAHTLLTAIPAAGIQTLPAADGLSWLLWRPDIRLPHLEEAETSREEKADKKTGIQQAVFIFGWAEIDANDCANRIRKSISILPKLTDTVGASITNILLAERVRELESTSYHGSLQEMAFLKAEMLASVSHELRSPLASMKGYTSTLLRHEQHISAEERHEFLVAISESSDRLTHIVDSFLKMSELETGATVMHRSPVNAEYLVREAIIAIEQRLNTIDHPRQAPGELSQPLPRHWTFTIQLINDKSKLDSDDLIIWADRRHLREVIDQLLENAIIHAQDGGRVKVTIHPRITQDDIVTGRIRSKKTLASIAETFQKHHQMIIISISDDGKGIQPHHLERIFDRFYRIDTQLTREVNRLGLGLTMSKRIVELHDGVMWAESEPGEGSTFHMLLPIKENIQ
jgi:signal transduction histidine kinase